MRGAGACWLLVLGIALGTPQLVAQQKPPEKPKSEAEELQEQIDDALKTGVRVLCEAQLRDGSWPAHNVGYPTGQTALAVYALLKAGVPHSHPAVQQGVAFITAKKREPYEVYSAGCQLLALEALGDRRYHGHMERIRSALIEAQKRTWHYRYGEKKKKPGHRDLSLTQFAVMGLWAATRAGIKVPKSAWIEAIEGTLLLQVEPRESAISDGPVAGFRYRNDKNKVATGSMTAAGITVLGIARHMLKRQMPRTLSRKVELSLKHARNWLTVYFDVTKNPGSGGSYLYYLFGLERAASLLGVTKFGDHDWYHDGARHLTTARRVNGETDVCFALLFLARATGTDLKLPGAKVPRWAIAKAWSTPEWMIEAARAGTKNILLQTDPKKKEQPPTITSSTNESDRHAAAKAMDGFQNTSWRWHQNDKQPWVEVALKTPKTARVIVLTNAASRRRDLGKQAYALRVSISINGGAVTSHPLEKDELRPTRIELPTPRRVKTLKIVVLEQKRRPATDEPAPKRKPAPKGKPVPKGKPLPVGGFAEISLEK